MPPMMRSSMASDLFAGCRVQDQEAEKPQTQSKKQDIEHGEASHGVVGQTHLPEEHHA